MPITLTPLEQKAWKFSKDAHKGMRRRFTSTTYFEGHVVKVFSILKRFDTRATLGAAAILHDTLEDVDFVTFDLIKSKFGGRVAKLVQELTSDESEITKQGKANYLLNKMTYMSDDALTIKLCDRLQNISDMYAASAGFRSRYYIETNFIITNLKSNRRLTNTHNKIVREIESLLDNIKNRHKIVEKVSLKYIMLFEDFKVNNITQEDIIKCIDDNGVIYATVVEDLPDNDPKEPLKPVSIDEFDNITVQYDNEYYDVKLKNVEKIEY